MLELMRRIGFPPFKRTRRKASLANTKRRLCMTESLEAKVLLAADLSAMPVEAFSIFSALSRGGDTMMAQAGIEIAAKEAAPIVTDTITAIDEIAADEIYAPVVSEPHASEEVPVQDETTTIDAAPAPVAAVPAEASGVLSATLFEAAEGEAGDVEITIGDGVLVIYNEDTGFIRVTSETLAVTTLEIVSESGIFTGDPALGLGGTFDIDTDTKLFKLEPAGFQSLNLGSVARRGLTPEFLQNDLTINGSVAPTGGLGNKDINVYLDLFDINGNQLVRDDALTVGDEFFVVVSVEDARAESLQTNGNQGVFAAYVDVRWNQNLASPVDLPIFDPAFTTATSAIVGEGLLDEVGAASSSISPTDNSKMELFRQRMVASSEGALSFSIDPADDIGREFLNFGSEGPIDISRTVFIERGPIAVTDTPSAPDLVAFAQALDAAGATFYGAAWCPHCTDQKELFEDGQVFLPFVEVTNPDRSRNAVGDANNIDVYPTWVFADGSRLEGQQSLQTLADAAGISIPESNRPTLIGIEDIDMFAGSPYHVPLNGYDPNGGELTYEVTVTGDAEITAEVLSGNRSLEIDVQGYGSMVFELFDEEAPRATEQITSLAESGFYDDIIFHRILDDFVLQAGDPQGTGIGGSDLPDFDDQFDFDLQHNRDGVLSMAKSSDDTNNSQFFITEVPSRHLDFNHTIFGQLIEGDSNREAMSEVPVDADSSKPLTDIPIVTANVFEDIENGLLRVSAPDGFTGSANITVTVRDGENHSFTTDFDVTVAEDEVNNRPFLLEITEPTIRQGETYELQLEGVDLEGDPIMYGTFANRQDELDVNTTFETGFVTITPKVGFAGKAKVTSSSYAPDSIPAQPGDRFDAQIWEASVPPPTPTFELLGSSDSGQFDDDNITNATTIEFELTNLYVDTDPAREGFRRKVADVELLADGQVIETMSVTDTTMTISTDQIGEGVTEITVRQLVDEVPSDASATLTLTVDRTAPDAITSSAPTAVFVDQTYTYNVEQPQEGDVQYSLSTAPAGATIDDTTGVISWTPTSGQAGNQSFTVVASDVAGNVTDQSFVVSATSAELMVVTLRATDTDGNEISAIPTGQSFMLDVYVEDIRTDAGDLQGVFAAYVDINFPSSLLEVTGAITYGSDFSNAQLGSTATAGLIDDAGATSGDNTPLGAGEFLLMSIPMRATAAGQANFSGDLADDTPLADSLVNGTQSALTESQVGYVTPTLDIVDLTFAVDDSVQMQEDGGVLAIDVLNNDIRIPSDTTITIVSITSASNGNATINADNTEVNYEPAADFNGNDSFTYTIRDEAGNESTGTVTIEVLSQNDDPIANDDVVTTSEDAAGVEFDVLANDSTGADSGETLSILSVTPVANGDISVINGTQILYTPSANFNGSETVQYTVSDGNGGTDTASLTINVTEVNDAPTASGLSRSMDEDTSLTISVSDLISNGSAGPLESEQTLSLTLDGATNGTASRNGDTITFVPSADFAGTAELNYTLTDDGTDNGVSAPRSGSGTVSIEVRNTNDPPIANDDVATAQAGGSAIAIDAVANDSFLPDPTDTLTITAVSAGSAGGTAEISSDGRILYTAPADFSGTDTLTYTITDSEGATASATIEVNVSNFVPGGITGYAYFDTNRDNLRSINEMALAGVEVLLSGTTDAGETLSRSVLTNREGFYEFEELIPGTYTITQMQPGFTVDGDVVVDGDVSASTSANSFTVELGTSGTTGTTFNFTEQSLEPRFSIWEALASSGRAGMYSTISTTSGHQWSQMESGWQDVEVVDIAFNGSRTAVTMTIVENGVTKSATIPTADTARIQVIGQEGDNYLVRVRGARSEFNFS